MTEPRAAGKLGRRPYDPTKPAVHLDVHLRGTVPPNPAVADWLSKVVAWPIYGNDQYGDCVWAMIGHMIEAWTQYAGTGAVEVTTEQLLAAYSAVTGFNPADPNTDQGTNIQDALNYWRTTGVAGHKIVVFAKVDHTSPTEVEAAINLFGSLAVGVNLPASAQTQFNAGQEWTVVDGSPIEGGHAIHAGAYDTAAKDARITTWGAVQTLDDPWWTSYVEEAWVVVTPEWVAATGQSPSGLDLTGLGEDFASLTGEPNPFQPAPGPVPGPSPIPVPVPPVGDPDDALALVAVPWVAEHHWGHTHRMAEALSAWLSAKQLGEQGL
jgi:hypothetical protein